MDKCPSGLRSTPRKRVRANPSASSNLALSASRKTGATALRFFYLQLLLVHGSIHPLVLLHIAAGENADIEHAIAVITTMRDRDVVVVDHTVVRRIKTDPTLVVVHLHPGMRGALSTQQSGDVTRGETNMATHRSRNPD